MRVLILRQMSLCEGQFHSSLAACNRNNYYLIPLKSKRYVRMAYGISTPKQKLNHQFSHSQTQILLFYPNLLINYKQA